MIINIFALFVGVIALVYSTHYFVEGASAIAKNWGISTFLIGLTIVGLGTSAPEILVSAIASLQGNSGLAIGNALGSNIANMGLVLGTAAILMPIAVPDKLLKREFPVLIGVSIGCYLLALDGLSLFDGLLMLIALVMFMVWVVQLAKRDSPTVSSPSAVNPKNNHSAWLFFLMGLVGLLLSSKLLIWAAVNIANQLGVSDIVIGLTIVALGTSLPELATTVGSVLKKQPNLALGNIMGSNIYNLLAVYSLPNLIAPEKLEAVVLSRDFPIMIGLTLILFFFARRWQHNAGKINRLEGSGLLMSYFAYQALIYSSVS